MSARVAAAPPAAAPPAIDDIGRRQHTWHECDHVAERGLYSADETDWVALVGEEEERLCRERTGGGEEAEVIDDVWLMPCDDSVSYGGGGGGGGGSSGGGGGGGDTAVQGDGRSGSGGGGCSGGRGGARGRGLHSSTFWLNLSTFCGIGVHVGILLGVFRMCQGVLRSIKWCSGCVLRQKRLRLS